jgi:pre-mRNA-processing factor SLU7
MATDGDLTAMPQHKSEAFEDRKRKKELSEARMSGKAAPEIDVESGKMINPHNPEYITKRPWYLGESGPSLNHHAVQKKTHVLSLHEADQVAAERKKRQPKTATLEAGMWVEALKHGKTPWLQAKVVRLNLDGTSDLEFEDKKVQKKVPREHVKTSLAFGSMVGIEEEGKLTFDAKRDRWHGYDPSAHKLTVDRYNKMDDERRKRRQAAKDDKYRRKQADAATKAKRAADRELRHAAKAEAKKAGAGAGAGGGAGGGGRGDGRGAGGGAGSGSESPLTSDAASESEPSDAEARSAGSDSDSDYDSDSDAEGGDDDEADDREFIQRDSDARDFQRRIARQGGIGGAQMKTTVRNLRIREDTAKYLRNLDPNSAYYDPKTRSMRDNPLPNSNPEEVPFAGDNFQRVSGDAVELARTTIFAWEATARSGGDVVVDAIANPSQVEFARREFEKKKGSLEEERKRSVAEKYGGPALGAAASDDGQDVRRLALGTSEAYVEYGRDGRVVRGAAKAVAKSKYAEDVLPNNHSTVWGSWFDRRCFRWGFGDDHSLEKNSYSTGVAGRAANEDAALGLTSGGAPAATARPMLAAKTAEERAAGGLHSGASRSAMYGEQLAPVLDAEKLKAAVAKERAFRQDASKHAADADDKKRKYNSMGATAEPTPEEQEAYRMLKPNDFHDPMAAFKDSEEVLEYDPLSDAAAKKKR